jgi:hypothetical protein
MKKIRSSIAFLSTVALLLPVLAQAQNTPILPKEWKGTLTLASIGATTVHNPMHKSNSADGQDAPQVWNSYVQPRQITIKRQVDRNLEFLVKGPKVESLWVGTLSEDGKEIIYSGKHGAGSFKIHGNKISGCGTSRGIDGNFDHWLNSYSSWCWEFTSAE